MSLSTKELARALGQIETLSVTNRATTIFNTQPFDYLFVLDFEATCWETKTDQKLFPSEIIEFPVVLYDVKTGKFVSEFQQYVMPTENSILTNFCTTLTGIAQYQVNNGVPIGTCILLFNHWMQEQIIEYNLTFNENSLEYGKKKSAIVTWSDWDLGTCWKNECRRKGLRKYEIFNKWIDLRYIYKEFYKRKPRGLSGALSEVGLQFDGREHCGLDDAKNTAFLAGRMILDGVLLRITKDYN